MRSSNKSRSRNRNQNRRSSTNVINRVFDSSGPSGKVRGTPQQIIEKYQMHARDAQLSGDRVAAENFLQHSEHYARLFNEAQREQNHRRELQEAQQNQHNQRKESEASSSEQPDIQPVPSDQPDVGDAALSVHGVEENGLVETPEGKSKRRSGGRPKKAEPNTPEAGQAAE